jgi:hypothetical protein
MNQPFARLLALTALAIVTSPLTNAAVGYGVLQAQGTGSPMYPQEPATVALVDQLPPLPKEYAAVILRRADGTQHDMILLPRATATAEVLDAATRVLLRVRQREGQRQRPTTRDGRPVRTLTIGVRPSTPSAAWAERELPRARKLLAQLRGAPIRSIPGVVGTAQAVYFFPPNMQTK